MEACLIMPVLYSPSNQLPNNQPTNLPLINPNGYDILNIEKGTTEAQLQIFNPIQTGGVVNSYPP